MSGRPPRLVLKLRSSREPGLHERVWAPDARRPGLLRLPPEGMQDPNAAATPSPGKRGPRTPTTSDPARACLQRPRRAVKAEMCEQESPLKIPSHWEDTLKGAGGAASPLGGTSVREIQLVVKQ